MAQLHTPKEFKLDLLPKLNLTRVDSDTGRRYITPEGNSYQSVTTFLSSMGAEYIKEWKSAVGELEAKRVSEKAATRGTQVHECLEQYVLNRTVDTKTLNFLAKPIYNNFIGELNKVDVIRAVEYPLYSDIMRLAGTIDLLANYDGVLSTIDFKTATKKKDKYEIESYFIQASIYSYMIEERYGIVAPQLVILIGVEFSSNIQVFIEDRSTFKNKLVQLLKERIIT